MAAYLGSVATACSDTLASEIGQTYKVNQDDHNFEKSKERYRWAVSWLGEWAAFFGSLAIAILAYVLIQEDTLLLVVVTAGGFVGTNIDSVLGPHSSRRVI